MCHINSRALPKPFLHLILFFTCLFGAEHAAAKQSQNIFFDAFPQVATGGVGTIAATASSGLPVAFSSKTPNVCAVSGNSVAGVAAGLCKVAASQPGNSAYAAAPALTYTFKVVAPVANLLANPIYADSQLQGDWNFDLWTAADGPVTANADAPAPSFSGKGIEVLHGPGGQGWGAFGLANRIDWNHVTTLYMNEVRTLEFDLYIEPDSTGIENLKFVLEDGSYSNEPGLAGYIPGWNPANPAAVFGRWIHVSINLAKVGAKIPGFSRFLFWNSTGPDSHPHYHLANVLIHWVRDVSAPTIKLQPATPNLTYDTLALKFTTSKATLYKVDYGTTKAYGSTIAGDANGWSTQHSVNLTGLSRGHTYYYQVTAWGPEPSPKLGVKAGAYKMPAAPAQPPAVSSFTATPAEIPAGQATQLTWAATGYDTLTIDPGVGSVAQTAGTAGVTVRPAASTTYTLTATNKKGATTLTVPVTVHDVPAVHSFGATPAKIAPGGATTLKWDLANFDTLSIDHGIGDVTAVPGTVGVPVSPSATTTYMLTATNAYGETHQAATVIVDKTAGGTPINPVWVMGYYVGYHNGLQPPDKIDYSTMTHIMVGAAIPKADGSIDTTFYLGQAEGPAWAKDTVDRAHAAGIKAILMLGGAGALEGFEALKDPGVMAAFVANLKQTVDNLGFDGVDIDWEPLPAADQATVVALLQALQAPGVMPRSAYLYTIPVGWNNSNPWMNEMADPFWGALSAYVDRIDTMSYSMLWFGEGWESWHTSALFGETPSTPSSIDNTVQALRTAGVPDAKIGIGVGFYGTAYENGYWTNGYQQFVHQDPPAIAAYVTAPRQNTDTAGARYGDNSLSYSNIMQYLYLGSAYRWDDVAKAPYLSFEQPLSLSFPGVSNLEATYVTYDDERSIAEKGAYVRNNGLGGVIVWTISQGYLGNWKQAGEVDPMMKAVKEAFLD